ncbi:DMT family transporter [Xinfangfangia sp. CPCC 101601]|uniref:DMT family transporter n=1 Tax=Pseudogemmobacter lacusdianii TaxID=3069608 RepID=A0ABU0VZT2_9RHOB|nr:DMT family transporter [Xinfangfangia sp. CPCC 101601]MDQ2067269.1 DMT family transporter [Xinfangfangia sp. CPCC 101601]
MSDKAASAAVERRRPLLGIAWMLVASLCFVGVNGGVKYLGTGLPAAQSSFIRFAFGAIFFLPMVPKIWAMQISARLWRMFGWRALLHVAAVVCWFHAMARVPVAEISAIGFLNPVMVMLVAGILLGDRLGLRQVMVVLAAMLGALLVLRPGFREISEGHLSQLAATTFFAMSYVIARRLALEVPAAVVVAVMSISVTFGLMPLAAAVWVPVSAEQLAVLAGVAALGTLAHYAMTKAFVAAPLTVTQPVNFLQIVWSAALGALAFGEAVDPWVLAGAAVIIGVLCLNTWIEARKEGRAKAEALAAAAAVES